MHFTKWFGIPLLLTSLLSGCGDHSTLLEQVVNDGTLVVVTRNASTTYYEDPMGQPTGLEYELASLFAEHLGVKLKVVVANNLKDLFTQVARGEVHFAAAGLTATEQRKQWVRFTTPVQDITQQVVYRSGSKRPENVDDLIGKNIEVVAHSSHVERLQELKTNNPDLRWIANDKLESEELLDLVKYELVDYVVLDSNEYQINRHLYPRLNVGFNLSAPEPMAWAFPLTKDTSLYDEANRFIETIKANGILARVVERHYGHVNDFDHVGTLTLRQHVQGRLPDYEAAFKESAGPTGFDWVLLAAVAYQESHWNANAISPTGVRGLMMLTNHTAEYLGVDNRRDPLASIEGGARYLRIIYERLPDTIKEPDRTWMALASYNIGIGHLNDARAITLSNGGDPDKWVDVKKNLPLLRKHKWYSKTKHGYARGNEAVTYVENIRSYYEILHKELNEQRRIAPLPGMNHLDAAAL